MSAGEVITTSSTGGQKAGNDIRMSLLPVRELLEVAELYGKGAKKYSDHNWAKGYEWSKSYDAMNRHAMEFWAGHEADDGEGGTGLPHLTCVVFHALSLLYFSKHHRQFDDRLSTISKT
ncbi:dATP/dGTP diphosphohydrolase domain-containing protein [Mycobacteroides franklinii]|uniref:dATP/dGTP diphosphohydrolase domain-containing protein n=1 Tax=Mycobacteroides franklinii TaxID=948102 RepID=UPI0013E8AB61